jgi:NAD(P)H-hydrate epimerase
MSNAGRAVAAACRELLGDGGEAVALCGAGNNGGDGIAAAAYLLRDGVPTRAFLIGEREKMSADAREMERKLVEYGGTLESFSAPIAAECISRAGVIADAIFGIGLSREVRGEALEAVRLINDAAARVVSADVPSGVSADTGEVLGEAVRADVTVTFSTAKPGHFIAPGCVLTGELRVRAIGVPWPLIADFESDTHAVVREDIAIPRRERDTHKGDYGRVLIIAGSVGYTGAPVLAARAATLTGAGLVWLGVPEEIYQIAAIKCDGEIAFPLEKERLAERIGRADAVLIGPGMGNTPETREIVENALRSVRAPVILDADGINALSGNIDVLDKAVCPVILTPHDGEFERLAGKIPPGGRLESARKFAVRHGCVLILKGYRTITALPDGTAYINTTGNPGMAKGGSGDVLAGMLSALLGQGFAIKDACLAAVYLHGAAGDLAAGRLGEYSMSPGDILGAIPGAISAVTD